MRTATVLLWVLAGFLLVVAVRSHDRAAAARAAPVDRELRRAHPLAADPREAGRVGPCWDDVAQQLLYVGTDRWIGIGCDVEGSPRPGESPECTLLRQKITKCLRGDRRGWVPVPPKPDIYPPAEPFDGCNPWGTPPKPVGGAHRVPMS